MPALTAPPSRTQRPQQVRSSVARSSAPEVGNIAPLPDETQARFVDRCLRTLRGTTDERNAACYSAWDRSGRETELQQIARRHFPADKFRRIANRPLFVEHSRARHVTDPQTGEVREVVEKYDRAALEAICDRLNERIRDTGDFPPLTAGHTPSEESRENGADMPDVLGYAGPFRLGVVGNVKPRFAIFGDEYHHIDELPRLQKMQRRSPEVWLEENMGDRFFDPIACLGAETPRLDMGLTRFCRAADGRQVAKYSAVPVEPGGANTFLPSFDTGERRKLDKNAAGDKPMALAPEDVKQIVDALQQLDWVQWVKEQMNSGTAAPDAGTASTPGADAGAPPPDAGMPPADAGAPPANAGAPPLAEDNPDQNAAGRMMYECGDDDREMMGKYAAGEVDDEEFLSHMQGKKAAYQASATVEDPSAGRPNASPSVADPAVSSYSRDRGDIVNRYARLEKEYTALKARVDRAEAEKTVHYRRSKLTERLHEGYAFDLEDEVKLTSDMTAPQFERHVSQVIAKYERAPVGMQPLFVPTLEPNSRQTEKYARERKDKITALVARERAKGVELSWDEAAEKIDAGS